MNSQNEGNKTNIRKFIIGRHGDIKINDASVSKRHAELQIRGNREIYLRDCGSTNGTFLLKNNRCIPFHEGYVQLHQQIVIGTIVCSIREILEKIDILVDPFPAKLENRTINRRGSGFRFKIAADL